MNKNKKLSLLKKISITMGLLLCIVGTFHPILTFADDAAHDPCANNTVGGQGEGENTSQTCVEPPLIPKPDTLPGPSASTDVGSNHENYLITDLIPTLIRGAINLLGGITIIALMYAGIQYLTAFGDDTKLESAKKNLTYAIIGLFIALFSYTIVRIISDIPLSGTNEIQQATQDSTHTTQ